MRKTAPQLVDINGRGKTEPAREAQEKIIIPTVAIAVQVVK
jgi:hypothetical protein